MDPLQTSIEYLKGVGPNRADLFFGRGEVAEKKAGILKKKIYLHAFIPYSN